MNIFRYKTKIQAMQLAWLARVWRYMIGHLFEIEVFMVISIVLGQYKRIPYVNVYVTPFVYYSTLIVIAIQLFRIPKHFVLLGSLAAYLASFIWVMQNKIRAFEQVAEGVYFALLCVLFLYIRDYVSKNK